MHMYLDLVYCSKEVKTIIMFIRGLGFKLDPGFGNMFYVIHFVCKFGFDFILSVMGYKVTENFKSGVSKLINLSSWSIFGGDFLIFMEILCNWWGSIFHSFPPLLIQT